MATGATSPYALSADQLAYATELASATGLAPSVVTTWIGAESPWNSTSVDHNYLNVTSHGTPVAYATAAQGAAAAAQLILSSSDYAGIRQAIASGSPAQQIAAIQASPWDKGNYGGQLTSKFAAVTSAVTGSSTPTTAQLTGASWWQDLLKPFGIIPTVQHATKPISSAVSASTQALSALASALQPSHWQHTIVTALFVLGAAALIVFGVTRMFPGVTRTVTSAVEAAPIAA